jgi:hypothetical protein
VSEDGGVTLTPSDPSYSSDPVAGYDATRAIRPRRRRIPPRAILIGVLVGGLVALTAGSGIRGWWAARLHDITGASWGLDYLIGAVVGLLPLLGVVIGSRRGRGHRRLFAMLLLGAAGFCVTYLLSPSAGRMLTDSHAAHVFNDKAPGYLPGVLTAEGLWLVARALAWWRLRRWRRARFAARRPTG